MTERGAAKPKRQAAAKVAAKPRLAAPSKLAPATSDHGSEALAEELKAAKARIAELEGKHAEIISRIEWLIDSLKSLRD